MSAYLQGCAVSDLPRVRLTKTDLHTQLKAAWDSSNPLMMCNDTYHWWSTHTHNRRRTFQTPPGAAAPCRLWNYTQAIIRSACTSSGIGGVHKHPCCFSVLLPAVKQRGAPVEPTQACPPLGSPSPCLQGGRHTQTNTHTFSEILTHSHIISILTGLLAWKTLPVIYIWFDIWHWNHYLHFKIISNSILHFF